MKRLLTTALMAATTILIWACTSILVAPNSSTTGRPLMWKHRDTGAPGNFLEKVEAGDDQYGYIALYNDGDSLLREAWMGCNEAGFAIMNTASYNLHPYYSNADGEGLVMSAALRYCRTVDDFEDMLRSIYAIGPATIGINANFGVMDAQGAIAYIEADDYGCVRYDVDSVLIRTNFSVSGSAQGGKGYVRYDNACHLLRDAINNHAVSPELLTETASKSFWNDKQQLDYATADHEWIPIDNDFIPRSISTSSIVIEGIIPEMNATDMRIWAQLGYPPCADLYLATLENLPAALRPVAPSYTSPACNQAMDLRRGLSRVNAKGQKQINIKRLSDIMLEKRAHNLSLYNKILIEK